MINIKVFVFNPFMENTYILHDDTKECIIIDPGCSTDDERNTLRTYIEQEKLKPVGLINTHTHVDHILGNNFVFRTYKLKPVIHKEGEMFLESAPEHASIFGIEAERMILPEKYLEDGEYIQFGNSSLEVLYTPGHANGSICLVSHDHRFVITGDVLFQGGIGRTDLPTGNYETLLESITQKLYTLPDEYAVYPGHGPGTTIGEEKSDNPFIRA